MPTRPWGSSGLSWLIVIIVLVVAILSLLVPITVSNLLTWLIIAVCIALLI